MTSISTKQERPAAKRRSNVTLNANHDAKLSPRELEVARLVASGLLSRQIATSLDLSTRTVEKYRAKMMRKLGVRNVPALVFWCLQRGLANPPLEAKRS